MSTETDLRRAMSTIATALEAENSPESSAISNRATASEWILARWKRLCVTGVAVGAAAALIVAIGLQNRTPGTGADDIRADAGRGPSYAEAVACARQIFVGNVTATRREGERFLVTFAVENWIKPGTGPSSFLVDLPTPPTADDLQHLRVSKKRWLMAIQPDRDDVADAVSGRSLRFTTRLFEELVQKPDQPVCPGTSGSPGQ